MLAAGNSKKFQKADARAVKLGEKRRREALEGKEKSKGCCVVM